VSLLPAGSFEANQVKLSASWERRSRCLRRIGRPVFVTPAEPRLDKGSALAAGWDSGVSFRLRAAPGDGRLRIF